MIMPKKSELGVRVESASAATGLRSSNLLASHHKRLLSLRAVNLRAFSKKDKQVIFLCPIENLTSAPSFQFVYEEQEQEEEKSQTV